MRDTEARERETALLLANECGLVVDLQRDSETAQALRGVLACAATPPYLVPVAQVELEVNHP